MTLPPDRRILCGTGAKEKRWKGAGTARPRILPSELNVGASRCAPLFPARRRRYAVLQDVQTPEQ